MRSFLMFIFLLFPLVSSATEGAITVGSDGSHATLTLTSEFDRWGLISGYRFDRDSEVDDVLAYRAPHSDVVNVGNLRERNSMMAGATYRFDLWGNVNLRVNAGVGQERIWKVAESTATGWRYRQDESYRYSPAVGAVLRWRVGKTASVVGGFDTFVGAQAGVSWGF